MLEKTAGLVKAMVDSPVAMDSKTDQKIEFVMAGALVGNGEWNSHSRKAARPLFKKQTGTAMKNFGWNGAGHGA